MTHHWHLMDTFVYFAHDLVSLPPPGWTNAAHLNGVKVRPWPRKKKKKKSSSSGTALQFCTRVHTHTHTHTRTQIRIQRTHTQPVQCMSSEFS